jgi:hypothetical protein
MPHFLQIKQIKRSIQICPMVSSAFGIDTTSSMKMKLCTAAILAALVGTAAAAQTSTVAAATATASSDESADSTSSPNVYLHGSGTTNPSKCKDELMMC